jgi:hypothetical protein
VNELQDLDELLTEMYEQLSQQRKMIVELSRGNIALVATLAEVMPGFDAVYAKHYEQAAGQLAKQGTDRLSGLYDDIIRKLRGSG